VSAARSTASPGNIYRAAVCALSTLCVYVFSYGQASLQQTRSVSGLWCLQRLRLCFRVFVFVFTGKHLADEDVDKIIESGEAESIFQKAILTDQVRYRTHARSTRLRYPGMICATAVQYLGGKGAVPCAHTLHTRKVRKTLESRPKDTPPRVCTCSCLCCVFMRVCVCVRAARSRSRARHLG
jgi:hypothetical protein